MSMDYYNVGILILKISFGFAIFTSLLLVITKLKLSKKFDDEFGEK